MTAMQTAFAGRGDTTTSRISVLEPDARSARSVVALAFAEPTTMMIVTVSHPAIALAMRAAGRRTNASATDTTAPAVRLAAAFVDTKSTRQASATPAASRRDNSSRTTRELLAAT